MNYRIWLDPISIPIKESHKPNHKSRKRCTGQLDNRQQTKDSKLSQPDASCQCFRYGSLCFWASRIRIQILPSTSKNNMININQGFRIKLSCWIRIRIQIVDPDPDPGGQKWPTKIEKKSRIFMFLSTGCSLLRAEGFSCSLGVLYGGLGKSKLQFLIKKIEIKFPAMNFFQF